MFGDQTDVPESGDWWDAGYLIMWGSNVPLTRTPDAHWMTEARYRGQKVVAVSPDYAENVKFADEWVAAAPGTDGALAMAMGHVILKEFFVDQQVDFFTSYNQQYTDLPYLVTRGARASRTAEGGTGYRPGKYLVAGDFDNAEQSSENAMWKPAVIDEAHRPRRHPQRLDRAPLRRRGLGQVEPRARRHRPRSSRLYRWHGIRDGPRSCCRASTPRTRARSRT
jgi:nitrate reductase alpha subunit